MVSTIQERSSTTLYRSSLITSRCLMDFGDWENRFLVCCWLDKGVDGAGRGKGHFSPSEGGRGYNGDCTGGNKITLTLGALMCPFSCCCVAEELKE